MDSASQGVAALRRLIDSINHHELARVAPEVIAPDFVRHDLAQTWPGIRGETGVRDLIGLLQAAMPDLHFEIDDIFESGDRVAMRFTLRGTQHGELLGRPPTGAQLTVSGINIYRIENGKIAETWQLADYLGLTRQLDAANAL
jgi:steroid delta-isomerase-like uncharacterized protein